MNSRNEPGPLTIGEPDLLPVDSVALLQHTFKDRFAFGEKFIRNDPLIDKEKPMIYAGAGADLGTFLGSGVKWAYFVDTQYSQKTNGGVPTEKVTIDGTANDLSTLIAQVNLVADKDGETKVTQGMNEEYEFDTTTIEFQYMGEKRTIVTQAADARFFVPKNVGTDSFSVYVSFGVPVSLLTPPPGLQADAYVVSSHFPEMLGYEGVNHEALNYPYELTVAYDFGQRPLDYADYKLFGDSNFAAIDTTFNILMGWDEARVNAHQDYLEKQTGSRDLDVGSSIFYTQLFSHYSKCNRTQKRIIAERFKNHIEKITDTYEMKNTDTRFIQMKQMIVGILDQLAA